MITHLSNIENNQDNTSVEHSRNQNYQIYFSRSPDQSTPREGKISKSLQAVQVMLATCLNNINDSECPLISKFLSPIFFDTINEFMLCLNLMLYLMNPTKLNL